MTTQNIALKSFPLAAEEGRTQQALNLLGGASRLAKLTNEDTEGTVAIFQHNLPQMAGPDMYCLRVPVLAHRICLCVRFSCSWF